MIALLSLLVAGPELADAKQCASAVDLVKLGEGHKLCTYPDTKGHPTICYGFNLDAAGAEGKIHSVGGDWQAVRSGGCLDESQCETLLKMELESAMVNEKSIFGETCQCVEAALTDMTYNLGVHELRGFAHMIAAIKDKNWAHAADEAIYSSWCRYASVSQIHTCTYIYKRTHARTGCAALASSIDFALSENAADASFGTHGWTNANTHTRTKPRTGPPPSAK